MTGSSLLGGQAKLARHVITKRSVEILVLQGSPILGLVYGGVSLARADLLRPACLLAGSLFLTAHVFVFNDWSGYDSDRRDPRRMAGALGQRGVSRMQIAVAATLLLVLANLSLAFAGPKALVVGASIALLGFVYSGSARFGKNRPFAASVNHLLGGSLHFLLGYTLGHALDAGGVALSLFFGLVFAGGHLTQEIRDYDGDRLNGIRTCAVVFGCRRAFAGSVLLFSLAYLLAFLLAARGVLPDLFRWSPILLLVHLLAARHAVRRKLDHAAAVWMQRQYRMLFVVIGLGMLLG